MAAKERTPTHLQSLKVIQPLTRKLWFIIFRDGFGASDFHQHCDNKGPTLTIIQEQNGYLFGGYISLSWQSPDKAEYKWDRSAFIFTLSNPHNIPPTKYIPSKQAFCNSVNYGPHFYDIHVVPNSNDYATSWSIFPRRYVDTTGKGKTTFFEPARLDSYNNPCFAVSDIEIYSVL